MKVVIDSTPYTGVTYVWWVWPMYGGCGLCMVGVACVWWV